MSEPKPGVDAQAAYSRIVNAADKLFVACSDLDAAGGPESLMSGWTPKAKERARSVLKSARDALDGQLAAMKAAGRKGS